MHEYPTSTRHALSVGPLCKKALIVQVDNSLIPTMIYSFVLALFTRLSSFALLLHDRVSGYRMRALGLSNPENLLDSIRSLIGHRFPHDLHDYTGPPSRDLQGCVGWPSCHHSCEDWWKEDHIFLWLHGATAGACKAPYLVPLILSRSICTCAIGWLISAL